MRIAMLTSILVCCLFSAAVGQTPSSKPPSPPATEQAKQTSISPDQSTRKQRIQRESEELAALTKSIPADVASASRGMLPKDIIDKLNRIEKLSKQLRKDLATH